MQVILVDIDHTIANSFWRDHLIGSVPWDEYHAAGKDDKPYYRVINLINSLSSMGYSIVGVTGRTENFRQLTLNWFLKNHIDLDELLMRPNDVFLKNAEMKMKLVRDRFNGDLKNIHFLIDDNEETCIEFQKLGVTTLQIRNLK